MFQQTRAQPLEPPDRDDASYARVRAVEAALEAELPADLTPEQRWHRHQETRDRAEAVVKRERWAAGHMPKAYLFRLPFVHAHSVLYALDGTGKALSVLARIGPPGVAAAQAALAAALPSVVVVRNSAHHVEDRARGKGRSERDLELQPVDNAMVRAPGGALILSSLNGNRLGYTGEDGAYGDVDISAATVALAQSSVQQGIDAYAWSGPPRTVPD